MLKQLMLRKRIEQRKGDLGALQERGKALQKREEDLVAAIDEAKTDEEVATVEAEIDALDAEKTEITEKTGTLEGEIAQLEGELAQLKSNEPGTTPPAKSEERKSTQGGEMRMENRTGFFVGMTRDAVGSLVAREDVKEFLIRTREMIGQKRAVTGADLTIPTIMLDLLRDNLHRYSKLISKVRFRSLKGNARQNIAGTIPEAVWTEMVDKLNELAIGFNQIEMDGYKVGGFVPICNATLEDSDENLAGEIMDAIGQAIGLALDKAILYGTGVKMPIGIATRLAQIVEPANWGANAPAWTDLHVTNLITKDLAAVNAEAFFAALILALGVAKPNYSIGGTFWAMNRKTRMTMMSKSIAFNAAGAIVAGQMGTMPVEGGEIIELDFVPDGDIIGGFGSLYALVERGGVQLAISEHVKFIEDQTVFKGTARYDGTPVLGEGFIIVNINNVAPTTTRTFVPPTV